MSVEIKVTANTESKIHAIALGFGVELLNGRLDSLRNSPEYQSFLELFAMTHSKFSPKTWANLKYWLSYYNNPKDLEFILAPVFNKWINTPTDIEDRLASLSIGLTINETPSTADNSIIIHLSTQSKQWGIMCHKNDLMKLTQSSSLDMSFEELCQGKKLIPVPPQEPIKSKVESESLKKENETTTTDDELVRQQEAENQELELLKHKVHTATIDYIQYNRSVWYSIFHRHGKSGRQRANQFSLEFHAISDLATAKETLIAFLSDPKAGKTHPHSYRTMLLSELTESRNLREVSNYFSSLLDALLACIGSPRASVKLN